MKDSLKSTNQSNLTTSSEASKTTVSSEFNTETNSFDVNNSVVQLKPKFSNIFQKIVYFVLGSIFVFVGLGMLIDGLPLWSLFSFLIAIIIFVFEVKKLIAPPKPKFLHFVLYLAYFIVASLSFIFGLAAFVSSSLLGIVFLILTVLLLNYGFFWDPERAFKRPKILENRLEKRKLEKNKLKDVTLTLDQVVPEKSSYASEDVRVSVSPNNTSLASGFSDIAVPGEQESKQSIPVMPSPALESVRDDISPKSTSATSGFPNIVASKEQESKNVFSDIVVSGEQENKQSIPIKSSYASEGVSFSVSMQNPHTKFFSDMERSASREGKAAAFVPFMSYWPTYDSMNKAQQEWYFYWRSQIRQGNYMDTDLSYIFVLIYELLSGIGWQDPQEGYQKLMQLWAAYRKKFPSLDHYLTGWTFDFTQQYNLEYRLSDVDEYPRLTPSVMTDILITQHAEDVPLKLHFSLIDALSDYSLVNSKFYKDGNQDLMHEAIPRVIALADAALHTNKQKGILDTYGPSSIKKQEYYAFTSAVCPQANKKMYVTVKDYSTYPNLRAYIKELVRYGENTLRELRGYQGRLRGVTIDEETAKLIQNFLKKEYGQQSTQVNESSKESKVILDHEKIIAITIESKEVTIALDPTSLDPTIPEKKELLTDVQEVTAIYTAISPSARSLLDRLDKSTWECSVVKGDELLIAEINSLAERKLGRALLVIEVSKIIVEDDYRDELEYIYQNQPATSSEGSDSKLFDPSKLTSGTMKNFVDALEPVQQRALYVLITSENPQSDLKRIAEEELTMPQLLLDDINALALQIIEEIIVDTIDEKPRILDEYMDILKQSVV